MGAPSSLPPEARLHRFVPSVCSGRMEIDSGFGRKTHTRGRTLVGVAAAAVATLALVGCTPSTGAQSQESSSSPLPSSSDTSPSPSSPETSPSAESPESSPAGTPSPSASAASPSSPRAVEGAGDEDVDCGVTACVALTFDDGPDVATTGRLLDTLANLGVHATFFPIGSHVTEEPGLVRREAEEGHVVGAHTWDHPDLTTLAAAAVRQELESTATAVHDATGHDPALIRPPYGAWNDTVRDEATRQHSAIVLWNIDSQDWKSRNTQAVVDRVLSTVRRGSVVLMHDIYPTTVDAVPAVVEGLRERGLTPVTVPTLLGGKVGEGWVYYSQHDLIHPGTTQQTTE